MRLNMWNPAWLEPLKRMICLSHIWRGVIAIWRSCWMCKEDVLRPTTRIKFTVQRQLGSSIQLGGRSLRRVSSVTLSWWMLFFHNSRNLLIYLTSPALFSLLFFLNLYHKHPSNHPPCPTVNIVSHIKQQTPHYSLEMPRRSRITSPPGEFRLKHYLVSEQV